jgi:hypothetical protein
MSKKALWKQIESQKSQSGQSSTAKRPGSGLGFTRPQRKKAESRKATGSTRREFSPGYKAKSHQMRQYSALKKSFLLRNPWCAVLPLRPATHIHHTRGRLGSLLTDERYWVPVSVMGHSWIHFHPEQARLRKWMGIPLLCEKGKWNTAS